MNRDEIADRLETRTLGRSLEVRASTESTNDDARIAAERGAPHGHVVLADSQSSGRGSHGRTWSSPPGTDLYFSIVDRRRLPLELAATTTLAVGVAIAEVAGEAANALARIKWPNDVFIGGRKCAGILVETSSKGAELGARVIGIGVNVNRRAFEGYEATSIALERGSDVDRIELFARACVALEHWLDRQERDGGAVVADAVRSRLAFRDQKVRLNDEEGTVRGVADDGALLFENARGTTRVLSGRIEPLG